MTGPGLFDPAKQRWAFRTGRLRALGHEFGVRATDPEVGRYLSSVLGALAVPGEPRAWYSLTDGNGTGNGHAVWWESELVLDAESRARQVDLLLWHIKDAAITASPTHVLIHASAAEVEGAALLFPAPSEAGKTTLVAGLVQAGMRYLTDEVVAISPETLLVEPFPKALALDPGSWEVLSGLRPPVSAAHEPFVQAQWRVDPRNIRPQAVSPPALPRWVIAPRYQRGGSTALVPLHAAEAVVVLAENAFNLGLHGRRGLETLAAVVRRSSCYRLEIGDLAEAVALVGGLVDQGDPGNSPGRTS